MWRRDDPDPTRRRRMMTTPPTDYGRYKEKKVVMMVGDPADPDKEAVQHEGVIKAATAAGVLLKPKGRSIVELFDLNQILGIEVLAEANQVVQRTVKLPELGTVRQHLADRHGFLVPPLEKMTEEEAVQAHNSQHEAIGKDLGHRHETPATTDAPEKESKEAQA
jgi:hypothetical protein